VVESGLTICYILHVGYKRKHRRMPTPKHDQRVGKVYILRTGQTLDIKTDDGIRTNQSFEDDTKFLFLGVGKSLGRPFKGRYFGKGASQKVLPKRFIGF